MIDFAAELCVLWDIAADQGDLPPMGYEWPAGAPCPQDGDDASEDIRLIDHPYSRSRSRSRWGARARWGSGSGSWAWARSGSRSGLGSRSKARD